MKNYEPSLLQNIVTVQTADGMLTLVNLLHYFVLLLMFTYLQTNIMYCITRLEKSDNVKHGNIMFAITTYD